MYFFHILKLLNKQASYNSHDWKNIDIKLQVVGTVPNPRQVTPLDELLKTVTLEAWASHYHAFGIHCTFDHFHLILVILANAQLPWVPEDFLWGN